MKLVDLTGQEFGSHTVMHKAGNRPNGAALWECRCKCGAVSIKDAWSLKRLTQQTCRQCRPSRICEVDWCQEKHAARGLCARHYSNELRHGFVIGPRIRRNATPPNKAIRVRGNKTPEHQLAKGRQLRRDKRAFLATVKLLVGCQDCGLKPPSRFAGILHFDHRPEEQKGFNLSEGSGKSWQLLREEILKCDVVCGNCHWIRTVMRGQHRFAQPGYHYVST